MGLAIYALDGVWLGDIIPYVTKCCLLTVEKGVFKPIVLIVPFKVIQSIDCDAGSIILTLPRATFVQDQATLRSTRISRDIRGGAAEV